MADPPPRVKLLKRVKTGTKSDSIAIGMVMASPYDYSHSPIAT